MFVYFTNRMKPFSQNHCLENNDEVINPNTPSSVYSFLPFLLLLHNQSNPVSVKVVTGRKSKFGSYSESPQ